MIEALDSAIESAGAVVAFALVFLGAFCFLFFVALLAALLARRVWHELRRRTWGSVIVSIERKAFRGH